MGIVKNLDSPFAGLGLFVLQSFWGGTDLTSTDAAAYVAAGVETFYLKCSDGLTGDPGYPADNQLAYKNGAKKVVPWSFIYGVSKPFFPLAEQVKVAIEAAGGLKSGDAIVFDIEESVDVPGIQAAVNQYAPGLIFAVTTWDDPAQHPGSPSIGQLADIGTAAFLPQAYYAAQATGSAADVSASVQNYDKLGLSASYVFVPVVDGPSIVPASQEAAALNCSGLVAFRHGANGVVPSAFSGATSFVPPPPPPPNPTPAPVTPAGPSVSSGGFAGQFLYSLAGLTVGGVVTVKVADGGDCFVTLLDTGGELYGYWHFAGSLELTSELTAYVVVASQELEFSF